MKPSALLEYPNLDVIAERAKQIYRDKYQHDFEAKHRGDFAVINIKSGSATLGKESHSVLRDANAAEPDGVFFLIRVGSRSAY